MKNYICDVKDPFVTSMRCTALKRLLFSGMKLPCWTNVCRSEQSGLKNKANVISEFSISFIIGEFRQQECRVFAQNDRSV